MSLPHLCPSCKVDLEDDGSQVRCWRCNWSVRSVDNPIEYYDRSDAVREVSR